MPVSGEDPIERGPKGGRKHTPGRGHAGKSQPAKRKRFQRRKKRQREEDEQRCREQWAFWDAYPDETKKLRPDLHPDCPRPDDEDI